MILEPAIFCLDIINQLIVALDTSCVFFEVQTRCLNTTVWTSVLSEYVTLSQAWLCDCAVSLNTCERWRFTEAAREPTNLQISDVCPLRISSDTHLQVCWQKTRGARLHFTETPADSLQCGVVSSRELLCTVLGLPVRQGVNRLYFEAVVLLRWEHVLNYT
jgi:hypothetical protein